jgi:biopolymer transport protein ExbB
MSNAMHLLEQGGVAMFMLLALLVVTLSIVIAWEFVELHMTRRSFVAPALDAWQLGDAGTALKALKGERNPLARVMASAMQLCASSRLRDREQRELAAQFAAERLEAARQMLRPLQAIAALAPLIGLFGTVMGLIDVFQQLKLGTPTAGAAASGTIDWPSLWGGTAQALLATAAGLLVAIIATASLQVYERIVERLHKDIESALTRIFVRPPNSWQGTVGSPPVAVQAEAESA